MTQEKQSIIEERLDRIEECMGKIEASQGKILDSLLGNIDIQRPGLIEETRLLKRDVEGLKTQGVTHASQIQETLEFKKSSKKMMGALAVIIPAIFAGLKFVFEGAMEFLKLKS